MTRRLFFFSSETQAGYTQLTFLLDAKPCTRTIGSPSPSSRYAISTAPLWKLGIDFPLTNVGRRKHSCRAGWQRPEPRLTETACRFCATTAPTKEGLFCGPVLWRVCTAETTDCALGIDAMRRYGAVRYSEPI